MSSSRDGREVAYPASDVAVVYDAPQAGDRHLAPVRAAALHEAIHAYETRERYTTNDPGDMASEILKVAERFEHWLAAADWSISVDAVTGIVQQGLDTDGTHHKQWALEQVARLMCLPVRGDHEPGVVP